LVPFIGGIPESFGQLGNLVGLDLSNNKLEGQFFFYFLGGQCPLTNLFFVQFYAGSITESLGNLANLQELWLNDNQLSGHFYHFWRRSYPTDHLNFTIFLPP
jgi:Leucine-rich repeat (LRR) protein